MRIRGFLRFIPKFYGRKTIWHGGAPPACPIGSACCGGFFGDGEFDGGGECVGIGMRPGMCGALGRCGGGRCGCRGRGRGWGGWGGGWNWLGSVTEIPIDKIASFTHNAI